MFTSTVRTLRATTLMLSKPRIASCSIYKSLDFYIHLHATEHRARQLTGPSPKKPIRSSIPPSWSSRPDIIVLLLVVIRIWYNIMSSYDMCYCMSLMLHLSTTFHHVSTIHVYMILHCEIFHHDAASYCGYCSYWWEHDSFDWFSRPWKYIQW